MSLDPEARTAKLQGGEEVEFEKALLATGAMVNILRVEGAELEGIHYLRAFGNSDAIREEAAAAERVVLIGGSYIGCEVAASLTAHGHELHDRDDRGGGALADASASEVGRWFHDELLEHGVELLGGEELEAFEGDGRVQAVVTKSGRTVEGDMVVVGAGVRPDTMLAERAGLEVDDGIVCDAKLETSVPGIFAAGDVCSLRQRRPRPAAAGRALGRGAAAGPPRGAGDARRAGALPRGALLLQRPRRLGEPRVRRPRRGVGRGRLPRRPRRRRVQRLVPEGRPASRARSPSAAPRTSSTRGR